MERRAQHENADTWLESGTGHHPQVPQRSTARQEADADTRRIRFEIGREIRVARLDAGASLRTAADRVGMSHAQLSRLERGLVSDLTIGALCAACAAVGLRLVVRAVPGAGAPLDAGQLALVRRLRAQLPASIHVRTEVPIPIPGDRRAWDAVLTMPSGSVPVEAEARLRDLQAIERRSMLKLRDSHFDRLVLLVADTVNNRAVLDAYRADLRSSFPLDTRHVLRSLRRGEAPEASGIVVL